jgi:DNA-binding transcriptional LysR family regulator
MRLEDMRLFAKVAEARSFTAAASALGLPKQTLSRRVAELEQALDAQLLIRTTRRVQLTDVGAAYAGRCAEIVRLAEEANRAVTDARQVPTGVLRVTADPVFGEAFVTGLVVEYARRWPDVSLEVMLTRRRVDLIEEGFDIAFRVGVVDEPALTATRLGPARVRYCASPGYVARHGAPRTPGELPEHACVLVVGEMGAVRWPFTGKKGIELKPVAGRLRVGSFAMAHAAVLGGLGIGIFPEFACADDLRKKRLVSVMDASVVDAGAVWLVHPTARYLAARVRCFAELAVERLGGDSPWLVPAPIDRRDRTAGKSARAGRSRR